MNKSKRSRRDTSSITFYTPHSLDEVQSLLLIKPPVYYISEYLGVQWRVKFRVQDANPVQLSERSYQAKVNYPPHGRHYRLFVDLRLIPVDSSLTQVMLHVSQSPPPKSERMAIILIMVACMLPGLCLHEAGYVLILGLFFLFIILADYHLQRYYKRELRSAILHHLGVDSLNAKHQDIDQEMVEDA